MRVAADNQRAVAFWRVAISMHTGLPLSERSAERLGRLWHVLDFRS